jgi:acetyltransferase-like isoleucine patch superfamily enzyme
VLDRDPPAATLANRLRSDALNSTGEVVRWAWGRLQSYGAIGPRSRRAARFGSFGFGSIITFPYESLVNEQGIHIGTDTLIAPHVVLSAGWTPGQRDLPERCVVIGDRCLIGRGSSVIGHISIEIGDDVWTGHNVHITDMNHGYERLDLPISRQHQPEDPVRIGDGTWIGHNAVVLPGATIGRHVVVGAGSVVTGDLPDRSVAVGAPARVIRRYTHGAGWRPARVGEVRPRSG